MQYSSLYLIMVHFVKIFAHPPQKQQISQFINRAGRTSLSRQYCVIPILQPFCRSATSDTLPVV